MLPALRELLPRGGLARGSVLAVAEFGLLCLALVAGASADGAWCGIAGIPEAGVLAAAGLGLDAGRTLLVPEPGPAWPQVVASLLDGCEIVLLRPPARASAQVRQRLEATLRRGRGVLLVAGDWPGAQVRLRVVTQRWTGLGDGHGRLRACCAEVVADGRGEAAMTRTRWLWLPAENGGVAVADPRDLPADLPFDIPTSADLPFTGTAPALRAVSAGERPSARRPPIRCPRARRRPAAAADHGRELPGLCCPDETRGTLDPGAARLLEQVIAVVTAFCPKVEVVEPGVCAFGARGPARYFGGETALAARIIAAVADLGVESRVGVADGLFAALLAARAASPAQPPPRRRQTAARPRPGRPAATRSWSYRRARPRSSWPRSR